MGGYAFAKEVAHGAIGCVRRLARKGRSLAMEVRNSLASLRKTLLKMEENCLALIIQEGAMGGGQLLGVHLFLVVQTDALTYGVAPCSPFLVTLPATPGR